MLLVTADPDDPDELRLVSQHKSNLARRQPVERWRVEAIVLPDHVDADDGQPIETSRLAFVEIADDVTADDVLAPRRDDNEPTELDEAAAWLAQTLADGPRPTVDVNAAAEAAGFSERTLRRARKRLGVEADGGRGGWTLALPKKDGQPLNGDEPAEPGETA